MGVNSGGDGREMSSCVYFRAMRRHRLAAGAALLLGLAACGQQHGNGKIATAGGGGTATPSASSSPRSVQESLVKYAQCMREHGIDMPDPKVGTGGGINISIPRGSSRSKVDKAAASCKQYLPNGGEPPKLDPAMTEQLRKFAQCMRANGVPKFPDPKPGGGIMVDGSTGIDPDSPTFKAAEQKCAALRPKPPAGGGTNDGGPSTHKGNG